ncbi:MAG: hypothetical protein AB7D27_11685 [Desulfomicrobium sp.]
MPITPSDILPRRPVPEIATGPVVAVGVGSVSVQIRPDLTVLISTSISYAVAQMVSVAIPGGDLSSPQIVGVAAGSAPRIRYVAV